MTNKKIDERIDEIFQQKWSEETLQAERHGSIFHTMSITRAPIGAEVFTATGHSMGIVMEPVADGLPKPYRILGLYEIVNYYGSEQLVRTREAAPSPCDCEGCQRFRERNRFQAGIMPPVDEELAASLL